VGDLALPVDELDGALVLLAGAVLREGDEPDPAPSLEPDHGRIWSEVDPDMAPGSRCPDCLRRSIDDLGIGRVEVNPKLRTTATRRDASVSEIETEEIGVGLRVGRTPVRAGSILDDTDRKTVEAPPRDG